MRNGALLLLDNDGDEDRGSEMFGGGRDACTVGEFGVEGTRGEGGTLLYEGCSAELREAVGDPGERLRVRANGDKGWMSVSLDGGGGYATGGIESGAGFCASGDAVLGGAAGGLYMRASISRETSRAAAAFSARSSSGSSKAYGGVGIWSCEAGSFNDPLSSWGVCAESGKGSCSVDVGVGPPDLSRCVHGFGIWMGREPKRTLLSF